MQQDHARQEYSAHDDVAEFVRAVIHCVLYHRGVYPASSFERRQLYGMAVPYHRHPKVVEYISRAVEQAQRVLSEDGRLDIRVPIIRDDDDDGSQKMVEMYRLVVSIADEQYTDWYRVYDDFRAVLLRLQSMSCSEMMEDASKRDVTFRIQICAQGARDLMHGWMVTGRDDDVPLTDSNAIPLPDVHIPCSSAQSGGPSQKMTCMIHVYT